MLFYILFGLFVLLLVANFVLPVFVKRRDSEILFIAGQIGAGKSSYSVKLARRALKHNRPVFSTDYIQGCNQFDIAWLENMKCPVNSLLIIDESALKFNSRDFSKINKSILSYFKKARHFQNDVVLISQTFSDTDKQIRDLATKILFLRKFGFFTLPVRVRGDITIDDQGQPTMKYRIGRFGKPFIPAAYGRYYDSWEDSSNRQICPIVPWDSPVMDETEMFMDNSDTPDIPSDSLSDIFTQFPGLK